MRRALVPLGLLLLCGAPAIAQEKTPPKDAAAPDDDYRMLVRFRTDKPASVSKVLEAWAIAFDALVVQDTQVRTIKVRFFTPIQRGLTWGTIKKILAFHDVIVTEERGTKGGPWTIKAVHRRNARGKLGKPGPLKRGTKLPNREERVTAVFPIKHGAALSIMSALRGTLNRDPDRLGDPFYVQGPELIIYADVVSRVRYAARLIEAMDVAGPRKQLTIFQLRHADAANLATVLSGILGSLRGGPASARFPNRRGTAGLQVFPDARTNRLAVTAFPVDLPLIRRVVREFDQKVPEPAERFHVYRCQNQAAKDLAERLEKLFAGKRKQRRRASRPGAVGGARTETETLIVPDEPTNTLLIQAAPRTFRSILEVLARLDRKARRVMIEVLVVEVSTPTDQLSLGVELASLSNAHDGSLRPAALTSYGFSQVTPKTDASGNVTGLSRTPNLSQGLTAVLTKDAFDRLPIIVSALQSHERVAVVNQPFAMTDDNKTASFTITNTEPYIRATQGPVAVVSDVAEVKATSNLKIKPRINSDDNLTLDVNLTLSSFSGAGSASLPPGTNTRTFTAEAITVPNNSYVVFGGLQSWTEREVENKVPLLGDIPILGHLFKNWTRTRTQSRLYVFIRPTIFSKGFRAEEELARRLRAKIHLESGRDEWLPPLVPRGIDRPGYSLQDEALEIFGQGSGCPFPKKG